MSKIPPHSTRPLTSGEISLVQKVFGDSINYSKVKVRHGKFGIQLDNSGRVIPNNTLYMHGVCYCDDYSQESLHRKTHFMHEMTHIWQFQNTPVRSCWTSLKEHVRYAFNYYSAAYAHDINPAKDLSQYGIEQQGRLVEKYYVLMVEKDAEALSRYDAATLDNLGGVMKNFIANPSYTSRKKNTP